MLCVPRYDRKMWTKIWLMMFLSFMISDWMKKLWHSFRHDHEIRTKLSLLILIFHVVFDRYTELKTSYLSSTNLMNRHIFRSILLSSCLKSEDSFITYQLKHRIFMNRSLINNFPIPREFHSIHWVTSFSGELIQ